MTVYLKSCDSSKTSDLFSCSQGHGAEKKRCGAYDDQRKISLCARDLYFNLSLGTLNDEKKNDCHVY